MPVVAAACHMPAVQAQNLPLMFVALDLVCVYVCLPIFFLTNTTVDFDAAVTTAVFVLHHHHCTQCPAPQWWAVRALNP